MQSPLLSISYVYDRQQVIYIFDKMRVKVNTQRLYVKCNNEHSGGCRRQPSTPAEGGRRAKLVCRYRVYHLSEAIKLKTRRPPAGFLLWQSHHSHTCKLWGTSAFSLLGFNGWFTFQFFHAVFCTQ